MANSNPVMAGALPWMTPYLGAMYWFDASTRLAQGWADWQIAAWQPVLDMQATLWRQWGERAGWSALPVFGVRGAEQLA
nr:hypothetical protein [uncultured Caldimonas sp.]